MTGLIGKSFAGLRVERSLGRGAVGEVFEVLEVATRRRLALKLLSSGPQANSVALDRFKREGLALAALSHPNVLQVHSVGSWRGHPYVVTELLTGGDLDGLVREGRLSLERALTLLEGIAAGVAAIHSAGYVHRDLKPANVLLSRDGRVKVADFGLAYDLDGASLTKTGHMLGTPAYMAPEVLGGERARDARVDVYSLGILGYELLTGVIPHEYTSFVAFALRRSRGGACDPRQDDPSVPEGIARVIRMATEPDPSARPPHAGEFLRLLRAAREAPPGGERARKRWRSLWAGLTLIVTVCVAGLVIAGPLRARPAGEETTEVATPKPRARASQSASPGGGSTPTNPPKNWRLNEISRVTVRETTALGDSWRFCSAVVRGDRIYALAETEGVECRLVCYDLDLAEVWSAPCGVQGEVEVAAWSRGRLALATGAGVARVDLDSRRAQVSPLTQEVATSLHWDGEERLLVGTREGGVLVVEEAGSVRELGRLDEPVVQLAPGAAGTINIVAGTNRGALGGYVPLQWSSGQASQLLSDRFFGVPLSLHTCASSSLAIGTSDRELFLVSTVGPHTKRRPLTDPLASKRSTTEFIDSYELDPRGPTLPAHGGPVHAVSSAAEFLFSAARVGQPLQTRVAQALQTGELHVWCLESGDLLARLDLPGAVNTLDAMERAGGVLVVVSQVYMLQLLRWGPR